MINDPCNDGYEESERVRILGEGYRNAETYRAMRDVEKKLHRNNILASIVLILAGVTLLALVLVFS